MPPGKLKISESVQVQSLGIRGVFENCVGKICGAIEFILRDIEENKTVIPKGTIKPIEKIEKPIRKVRNLKRLKKEDLVKSLYLSNVMIGNDSTELIDLNEKFIKVKIIYSDKKILEKVKISFTYGVTDITLEGFISKIYENKGEKECLIKFSNCELINIERQNEMLKRLKKIIATN